MNFKTWLIKSEMTQPPGGAFGKEAAGRFPRHIFGWLSPRGNFYEVDMYGHVEAIAQYPELKKLLPDLDEELVNLQSIKQWSLDQIDQGEHPEWHGYEMASDRVRYAILDTLYAQGCLRVGSSGSALHFEGRPQAIKSLYNKAKDLAEEYGMSPAFDPRTR